MTEIKTIASQVAAIMDALKKLDLYSDATIRTYGERVTLTAKYLNEHNYGVLHELTPAGAAKYLLSREGLVSQKTLDMDRNALEAMMRHVSNALGEDERLEKIKSVLPDKRRRVKRKSGVGMRLFKGSRIYTAAQIDLLVTRQTPHNALATRIAEETGVRAHELLSLKPKNFRSAENKMVHPLLFAGMTDGYHPYQVDNGGNFVREVRLSTSLASQLEALKLEEPRLIKDRGVAFQQRYEIGGGQVWTKSFGDASKRALGWSRGSFGLRHVYAQRRLSYLSGLVPYHEAMGVVAIELGLSGAEKVIPYLR